MLQKLVIVAGQHHGALPSQTLTAAIFFASSVVGKVIVVVVVVNVLLLFSKPGVFIFLSRVFAVLVGVDHEGSHRKRAVLAAVCFDPVLGGERVVGGRADLYTR